MTQPMAQPMAAPMSAHAAAERTEKLLAQLRGGPDPRPAAVAEELVSCLVQLYGAGLERVMAVVGAEYGSALAADPLVESLLLVHDLHPLDTETRIRRALGRLRVPQGELHYDGIDPAGVAHVRLAGGKGCRSSVRASVESAVVDAAPEVTGVEVEIAAPPSPLLQISVRPGLKAAS